MTVQIVEVAGEKMAMLPVADYERLLDLAEEKSDLKAAAEAEKRRLAGEEYLPLALVDRLIAGENPLRTWRRHRGLTLARLSHEVGISTSFLSEIENGKRRGAPALWRKLAAVLDVSADDILPEN